MHGQHTMASGENGVSLNDSNLGFINTLKTRYGLPVGYIDHSNTIYMPAVARSSGANFISKHLSLDKTQKGPDWFICLEPDDMKNSIQIFRDTCFSLSNSSKLITDSEAKDKKYMRRSIVAASDIEQGSVINRNMLAFKRPYGGIEPKNYSNLLGKTSKKPIKRNELISMEDLL